ncbi:MAG: YitT family protein [Clostridia bacterium]|nr:YitT family protein [Clostridia bacterium]
MSSKWVRFVIEYLGIFVGVVLTALALVLFLIPNKIAAGGVSGLATVVFHTLGFPVGLTMLAINTPLFIFSVKELGARFGIKTLFGTITMAMVIDYLEPIVTPLTTDPFLAALYGGILAGIGIGIVFKYGGTTGGTDLGAQLLKRFTGMSSGQGLLIIDAFVITTAAIFFNVELALFALIALFATAKLIDLVQEGFHYARAAIIISNSPDKVTREIFGSLNRGVTILKGKGAYSGRERDILLVVISQSEVTRLKVLVHDIDHNAFIIITHVHEALGEGFKSLSN